MKQFIHPKYLQLFYLHEETDEIKFVKIKWKDVVTFKMNYTPIKIGGFWEHLT